MNIGTLSYSAGGVCFSLLLLLLVTSWRGHLKGMLLVAAVWTTALWCIFTAIYAAKLIDGGWLGWQVAYSVLELLRPALWLLFLIGLLRPLLAGKTGRFERVRVLHTAVLVSIVLILWAEWALPGLKAIEPDFAIIGHMILALAGLVLIEHLYRNTHAERRWAVKYLYMGLGVMFAYDFFMYADALLFKRVELYIWQARGLVMALTVPLLAVAAARNPEWSLEVFVSRRVVLHSAALAGAGLYLLLMGGAGYYIRVYGGTWGAILQLVFLVGAGLLLAIIFVSGRLRALLKVLLVKHFFTYKYDYREEWLKLIRTLSSGHADEPLRVRAIRALAGILHSGGGLLWTRQENGRFGLAALWNMPEPPVARLTDDEPLLLFLAQRQWVIELADCAHNPSRYAGLQLPVWLQSWRNAWLIVPLCQGEHLYGFVVLADPQVSQQLNWEDHDLLKTAGRQVASFVALLDTTDALSASRQFEAFNRLSAYVMHDLKNTAAQLALVVANAARHKTNPAFIDDAIRTVDNAVSRMNRMLAQLRKGMPGPPEISTVPLHEVLNEVAARRAVRQPLPQIVRCEPDLHLRVNRERLADILQHLLQNAQEATSGHNGRVEVSAYREQGMAVIEISDNGCGMDERFIRERLFRPFITTKGNAGMGIGVYESREFAHLSGGDIDVRSRPGLGTTFYLRLPLTTGSGEIAADSWETEANSCSNQTENS